MSAAKQAEHSRQYVPSVDIWNTVEGRSIIDKMDTKDSYAFLEKIENMRSKGYRLITGNAPFATVMLRIKLK